MAVCVASLAIGQAAIDLCVGRRWSWLAPAVGLALVAALCWATVRLPGEGAISAVAVLAACVASAVYLGRRAEGGGGALRAGAPVAVGALVAASLPFAVEGRFGILGTSFNPDMSQHLLATARLAHDQGSPLLHQGYPLGPHAIVAALHKGLGVGLVQGFSGLTIAVAVLASLTALAAFAELDPVRRTVGALLVGLPYMVASYFAQGAFKETMQALFVVAFALALRESSRNPAWRSSGLLFAPAALIAVGSVYVYSFPGLAWLAGTAILWAAAELVGGRRRASADGAGGAGTATALAVLLFAVLALPELGRMIDFRSFETFDPSGPGLGNLFGQISPAEALGIWPSGDFRLSPGDGAVPAAGYYLGAAFAALLLIYGTVRCWRRGETAILAGLLAAAGAYVAARVGGTPYTAAKAIEVATPLAALVILLPLLASPAEIADGMLRRGSAAAAAVFALAAGACSVLAFANAPVGPASYSPRLTELRPLLASGSTLVLAPRELLAEEHGTQYLAWELRGGRVCIAAADEAGRAIPPGVRFVIAEAGAPPPFPGLRLRRRADPYLLWERRGPVRGASDCPLIAVRQARQGRG